LYNKPSLQILPPFVPLIRIYSGSLQKSNKLFLLYNVLIPLITQRLVHKFLSYSGQNKQTKGCKHYLPKLWRRLCHAERVVSDAADKQKILAVTYYSRGQSTIQKKNYSVYFSMRETQKHAPKTANIADCQ